MNLKLTFFTYRISYFVILTLFFFFHIGSSYSTTESTDSVPIQHEQEKKEIENIKETLKVIQNDLKLNNTDLKLSNERIFNIEKITNKDSVEKFIFPIATAFFSALFGTYFGYLSIQKRSFTEEEQKKIDATNKLILEAISCFQDLIAIKDNYRNKITDDPVQRLSCIRPIIINYRFTETNYSHLHYLTKISSKYKPDSPANIIYLNLIFSNFNSLLVTWKKRNEEILPVFELAVSANPTNGAAAYLSNEDFIKLIGKPKLAQLIGLTEQCISQTDDLILRFKQLFSELPDIAESQISNKVLKNYGDIFKYKWNIKESESFLKKIEVNKAKLDQISK